jgi:hypothetical protein
MVLIAAQRIKTSDRAGVALVVAGQSTVWSRPGEGTLDRPPAGMTAEPRRAADVVC